ncbi:phosphate ABC transporter substrate-binding protein [Acaryochloris thomasi]|nr:phosphate ABC transporter substrate-binding protein [Acaryochloris thomasi]
MNRGTFLRLMPLGFALALGLQACNSTSASNASSKLVLTGSSTVAPLTAEIAKRYEQENPSARVDVQSGGSSRGIADVRQKVADIGMVSRSLNDQETDLKAFPIAKDGIAIIVHKDNPIGQLTEEQVIGIYTDKINNWSQIGGQDAPITVVNKAEGRSTLELFLKHFKLESPNIKADVVIGDNEQGIKTVAGNPNSVGYVSVGTAASQVQTGGTIKLLPLNGVVASLETVEDGTFPLSRSLTLITSGSPTPAQQKFLDFAQSQQVHDIVQEQYFVPLS